MRFALTIVALATALGACSPASRAEPDRLVILDDGDVITIAADGTEPTTVASPPDGAFFQPVWSPDRSLIAFSLSADNPAMYVARVEDDQLFSKVTDTFPFYFAWSSRNELAILRNDTEGLRLDRTMLGPDGLAELDRVESGQPLYFSWSPSGNALAAHTGLDRLVKSDLTESGAIAENPGVFPAPNWTDNGILSMVIEGDRQTLVSIAEDDTLEPIATVGGPATFLPNHDASLVAVQSLDPNINATTAAFQTTPSLPANRLVVVDTTTGETTIVSTQQVVAFFWSPVDDQLLVLDIVDGPAGRWSVWNGEGLEEMARFRPDQGFLTEFLPFFDQYAQSVSLWAPDGSAFAFPGTIDDTSGIWVQVIGGEPTNVHSGSWVSWAP